MRAWNRLSLWKLRPGITTCNLATAVRGLVQSPLLSPGSHKLVVHKTIALYIPRETKVHTDMIEPHILLHICLLSNCKLPFRPLNHRRRQGQRQTANYSVPSVPVYTSVPLFKPPFLSLTSIGGPASPPHISSRGRGNEGWNCGGMEGNEPEM